MNSNRIFISILGFILFLMAQVLLLKNLVLFGSAFCFLYVLYILLLPVDLKIIPTLLIAFVLGLGVDFFYDTLGIHTASILFIAFVRKQWLSTVTPTGGYDDDISPSMLNMGIGWFATYALPIFLVHHSLFFFIESWGTQLFFPVLQKIIASVIFVFLMSIIVQLLFYRRRKGI